MLRHRRGGQVGVRQPRVRSPRGAPLPRPFQDPPAGQVAAAARAAGGPQGGGAGGTGARGRRPGRGQGQQLLGRSRAHADTGAGARVCWDGRAGGGVWVRVGRGNSQWTRVFACDPFCVVLGVSHRGSAQSPAVQPVQPVRCRTSGYPSQWDGLVAGYQARSRAAGGDDSVGRLTREDLLFLHSNGGGPGAGEGRAGGAGTGAGTGAAAPAQDRSERSRVKVAHGGMPSCTAAAWMPATALNTSRLSRPPPSPPSPLPPGDLYDIIDMYEAEEARARGDATMPRSSRASAKRFDDMTPGELWQVRGQARRGAGGPGRRVKSGHGCGCPAQVGGRACLVPRCLARAPLTVHDRAPTHPATVPRLWPSRASAPRWSR